MAISVGGIKYDLDLDDSKFKGKAQAASGELNGLAGAFKGAQGASTVFAVAVTAAAAGLVAFGVKSLQAYNESERLTAQLDAVLKSTKDTKVATADHTAVVGISAKETEKLSGQLVTAKERLTKLSVAQKEGTKETDSHKQSVIDVTKKIGDLEVALGKTSTTLIKGYVPKVQMTRAELLALSKELEHTTTISDEAGLAAINMGLVYTNISDKVFRPFIKTVVDTAYGMNNGLKPSVEDLTTTSKILGKAFEDPETGAGALKKYGINMTELEEKFKGTTTVMQKQEIMLDMLQKAWGGRGAAALGTFQGQMDSLAETFNDFQELIGKAIQDRIKPLLEGFSKWVESMGGAEGILKRLTDDILPKFIQLLPTLIGLIIGGLVPSIVAAVLAMGPLVPFLAVGAALGFVIGLLVEHFGGWGVVMAQIQPMFEALKVVWENLALIWNGAILPVLQAIWFQLMTELIPAIQQLWVEIGPTLTPILQFLAAVLGGAVLGAILAVLMILVTLIKTVTLVVEHITISIKTIKELFSSIPGSIQASLSSVFDVVTSPFRRAFDDIKNMARDMMNTVKNALNMEKRQSPSVIDIVKRGVGLVNQELLKVGDINIPTLAEGLTGGGSGGVSSSSNMTNSVQIHVDHVGDMSDVQAIGRELGFRLSMMPH